MYLWKTYYLDVSGSGDNRHFGGVMVNMYTLSAVERGFRKKKRKKKGIYQKFHFPFYFSSSQSINVFFEWYPTSRRYCVVSHGVV